jgi:hypothetical protein
MGESFMEVHSMPLDGAGELDLLPVPSESERRLL